MQQEKGLEDLAQQVNKKNKAVKFTAYFIASYISIGTNFDTSLP